MALRKIRTDEDPLLRKQSKEVLEITDRIKILVDDMYETMYEAHGVGLAAPQVGILRRVIVIDDYADNKLTMINPEILNSEGIESGFEGCLSVPDRQGKVDRKEKIEVRYKDIEGNEIIKEAEGYLARIIQHEVDHLEGILYTDIATEIFDITREEEEREELEL